MLFYPIQRSSDELIEDQWTMYFLSSLTLLSLLSAAEESCGKEPIMKQRYSWLHLLIFWRDLLFSVYGRLYWSLQGAGTWYFIVAIGTAYKLEFETSVMPTIGCIMLQIELDQSSGTVKLGVNHMLLFEIECSCIIVTNCYSTIYPTSKMFFNFAVFMDVPMLTALVSCFSNRNTSIIL